MRDSLTSVFAINHSDPIAPVILGVTSILLFAVIGRFIARRLGQPTVLGELCMGIVLGNIAWYLGVDLIIVLREGARVFDITSYTLAGVPVNEAAAAIFGAGAQDEFVRIISGPNGAQILQVAQTVDVFSRYGVIFLLFMVGLETDILSLRKVGGDSIRVAIIGVVLPFALGLFAARILMPELSFNTSLFVAATLGATSVGISANVLRGLGRLQSKEGAIILGAAIGDDILGLVILAVVSGIVVSGSVNLFEVGTVVATSIAFLLGAAFLGPTIVRLAARIMGKLDIIEAKMFTSYLFVMILAWVANLAGLATIVGAFAAGLILSDTYFVEYESGEEKVISIRKLITPLEVILVPIFFILMGIQVKLETFMSWHVVVVASGLLLAAIIGKLASGLGASRSVSRLVVGIGMLPRGEVGLVFAAIGRTLGVIDDTLFSAIVLMVIVTTVIAPPFLTFALRQQIADERGAR
jgi:Kef-type K+ transport system membrane component KefB